MEKELLIVDDGLLVLEGKSAFGSVFN